VEIGFKECSKCENNLRCKECALPHVNKNLKAEIKELKYLLDDKRKHGKWIHDRTYYEADECTCSLCGQFMTTAKGVRTNYCPNCGARMDGENNE
jgi:hypothetical protein